MTASSNVKASIPRALRGRRVGTLVLCEFDASPEGHALRFDRHGDLVGVTIINARWLLDHDGAITLTIPRPERLRLAPEQLHDALAAA